MATVPLRSQHAGGQTGASFGGLTQAGLDALSELSIRWWHKPSRFWGTARKYMLEPVCIL